MTTETQSPLDNALTEEELLARYPTKFTKPQLTWLLRNRHKNGLKKAGAVILVSRKYYILIDKFSAWMLQQNAG